MARRFLGLWRLLPQACKYDVGTAPLKATYQFNAIGQTDPQDPKDIQVKINWTDINNKDNETQYRIKLNGQKQLQEHYGIKMQGILKSTTYTEDGHNIIMEATRQLREGDKVLDVTMLTKTPQGSNKIFQRYEKAQQ